jgi:hypothetical protein
VGRRVRLSKPAPPSGRRCRSPAYPATIRRPGIPATWTRRIGIVARSPAVLMLALVTMCGAALPTIAPKTQAETKCPFGRAIVFPSRQGKLTRPALRSIVFKLILLQMRGVHGFLVAGGRWSSLSPLSVSPGVLRFQSHWLATITAHTRHAAVQFEEAGVRLAWVLNRMLTGRFGSAVAGHSAATAVPSDRDA